MKDHHFPFNFVFDYLPTSITIKPMFGMFAVYVADRIVMILRERAKNPENNGIWIATTQVHHESLKKDFPALKNIIGISGKIEETKWQLLPANIDDFEIQAIKVCELIKKCDPRIGRNPNLQIS